MTEFINAIDSVPKACVTVALIIAIAWIAVAVIKRVF